MTLGAKAWDGIYGWVSITVGGKVCGGKGCGPYTGEGGYPLAVRGWVDRDVDIEGRGNQNGEGNFLHMQYHMNISSAASISPPEQPIDTYTANPSEKMLSYLMFSSLVRNRNHTEGAMAIAPPRKKNIPATRWQPALLTRNLIVLMSGSGLSEQQQVLHIPVMHRSKASELSSRPAGRQNCRSRRSSWSTLEYHWKCEETQVLLGQSRSKC